MTTSRYRNDRVRRLSIDHVEVTLFDSGLVVHGVGLSFVAVCAVVSLVQILSADLSSTTKLAAIAVTVCVAVGLGWSFFRLMTLRFGGRPGVIEIRNPWRTYSLKASEVVRFEIAMNYRGAELVYVETTSGRRYPVEALVRGGGDEETGRNEQRELASLVAEHAGIEDASRLWNGSG